MHGPKALVAGVVPLLVVLTACAPVLSIDTAPPAAVSRASIVVEPDGTEPVMPFTPIVVRARDGLLDFVVVEGPDGPVDGDLAADRSMWTSEPTSLGLGNTYRIEAAAVDSRGVATTTISTFSTVVPDGTFTARVLSPAAGSTVGVGTPITVAFDRDIRRKGDVERALVVHSAVPILGAWAWRDDRTVEFRPKAYWPGRMPVRVDLNLAEVQGSKGIFGKRNAEFAFTLGPSMVTRVNADLHMAEVFRDGVRERTIPITAGKPGFETRSGILVIATKERSRIMDAATGGTDPSDPEYYRLKVEYAMRITDSGEFLHAAPWSVRAQGRDNVSHGCVGMSTGDAQWLYDRSTIGDVVEVVGTKVPQELGNGITVWTESWEDWLARSAAGPVITTVDGGQVGRARTRGEGNGRVPGKPSPGPTVSAVAFMTR